MRKILPKTFTSYRRRHLPWDYVPHNRTFIPIPTTALPEDLEKKTNSNISKRPEPFGRVFFSLSNGRYIRFSARTKIRVILNLVYEEYIECTKSMFYTNEDKPFSREIDRKLSSNLLKVGWIAWFFFQFFSIFKTNLRSNRLRPSDLQPNPQLSCRSYVCVWYSHLIELILFFIVESTWTTQRHINHILLK